MLYIGCLNTSGERMKHEWKLSSIDVNLHEGMTRYRMRVTSAAHSGVYRILIHVLDPGNAWDSMV